MQEVALVEDINRSGLQMSITFFYYSEKECNVVKLDASILSQYWVFIIISLAESCSVAFLVVGHWIPDRSEGWSRAIFVDPGDLIFTCHSNADKGRA